MDFRTKQCQSEVEALHMDRFPTYASIASRDFFSCSLIQAESRQLWSIRTGAPGLRGAVAGSGCSLVLWHWGWCLALPWGGGCPQDPRLPVLCPPVSCLQPARAACPLCSCPGGWAQPGGCSCGLPGDRDQTSSDKAHEVGWLLVNYLRKACWHFWGSTCICKKDYKSVCSLWLPSDKSFCFDTWGLQSSSFL